MTREVPKQELVNEVATRGIFHAIEHFVARGDISETQAKAWSAAAYQFFLDQIQEAQRETRRIDAVLNRLLHTANEGKLAKNWMACDPRIAQLGRDMTALDGWMISLLETSLTMSGFGAPERGRAKPHEIAESMDRLWAKRIQELDFRLKDPTLFRVG